MTLKQHHNQLKKVYKDLELEVPVKLEDIKLTKKQEAEIKKHEAVLIITPEINKDFTFYDLVESFDKKQKINSWIYKRLWNQYDFTQPAKARFVLMGDKNYYNEPGLYHINKNYGQQVEAIKKEKSEPISPVDYVILQALWRLKGEVLDEKTWTRFVGLKKKPAGGDSGVPIAYFRGGQVGFDGSGGFAFSDGGVRLLVGPNLNSSSFSSLSENLTNYLFDRGHTINKKLVEDIEKYIKLGGSE